MSEPTNGQLTGVIAILQRAGRQWRGLIGTTDDGMPRILAWREFDDARSGQITEWLAEHGAKRVVGVLPASAVVCRTCSLPDIDALDLQRALDLQAEAQLV